MWVFDPFTLRPLWATSDLRVIARCVWYYHTILTRGLLRSPVVSPKLMAEAGIEPVTTMQTYLCLIPRRGDFISPQHPIDQPYAD